MPPRHPDAIIPPPSQATRLVETTISSGGGGALGHPLVYMDMGEDDHVECGYCDRRFVLSAHPKPESEYSSPAARPPEAH